jgi:hypothetical protein
MEEHAVRSADYTKTYYKLRERGSSAGAELVLPLLFDRIHITSMVDVGCGTGTWLRAARRLGASRLLGIENPWAGRHQVDDSQIEIRWHNLEERLDISETFDLCVCLEVAEHLSPSRGETFVDDLCHTSKRILFGAAVPGQRGRHHVNERWQSFWTSLFKARAYVAMDAIRPSIWSVDDIPYWYRQNTLIYVHESQYLADLAELQPLTNQSPILDVVHPDLLTQVLECPDVKTAVRTGLKVPGALIRAFKRRVGP